MREEPLPVSVCYLSRVRVRCCVAYFRMVGRTADLNASPLREALQRAKGVGVMQRASSSEHRYQAKVRVAG